MKHLFLVFLVLLLISRMASAATCGCNRTVPHTGTYTVEFKEKLNRPGTSKIRVIASDAGDDLGAKLIVSGDGITAELQCNGLGGYEGPVPVMGQYMILWPTEIGGKSGVGLGAEFYATITRPEGIGAHMNEESLAGMRLTLDGFQGRATPGMCARVRSDIEDFQTLKAIHEDDDILDEALRRGLGSYASDVAYRLDSTGPKVLPKEQTTYQSLLDDAYVNSQPTPSGNAGVIGSNASLAGGPSFAASTNPDDCTITEPSVSSPSGKCRMAVLLDAMMDHENVHRGTCMSMKEGSFASEYRHWVNHPVGLSLDEAIAYRTTIETLEKWYSTNCG